METDKYQRDWLYAPVFAGMCRAESIVDGTLDLADIALFNELIALKAENDWRVDDANAKR